MLWQYGYYIIWFAHLNDHWEKRLAEKRPREPGDAARVAEVSESVAGDTNKPYKTLEYGQPFTGNGWQLRICKHGMIMLALGAADFRSKGNQCRTLPSTPKL